MLFLTTVLVSLVPICQALSNSRDAWPQLGPSLAQLFFPTWAIVLLSFLLLVSTLCLTVKIVLCNGYITIDPRTIHHRTKISLDNSSPEQE
ncbi:hypothetical protein KQX54_013028 [Cotesia glomerata]|uniref:Uncharacterized protein n=1 Tax=Cotesia glomerata TaxID=32391 RepID=A0AAV7J9K1_COTGL|nr:hypothetical protein KQX54_013028 [Cotesia glomerata]